MELGQGHQVGWGRKTGASIRLSGNPGFLWPDGRPVADPKTFPALVHDLLAFRTVDA